MESVAARQKTKSVDDHIKELLQNILNEMNDYIRSNYDTVKVKESERLKSIRNIATAIYTYFGRAKLMTEFENNLKDFFAKNDEAATSKKELDLQNLKLLPVLPENCIAPTLPASLYGFHRIVALIKAEMETMPYHLTLLGAKFNLKSTSGLKEALIKGLMGHEEILKNLSTNVYMVIYSTDVMFNDVTEHNADFANYIYEALTTGKYYEGKVESLAQFGKDSKNYHIAFCTNMKEAADKIRSSENTRSACCFGAEFCFTLRKIPPNNEEQYVPLLSSVSGMDVWEYRQINKRSAHYALECHAIKPMFVITPDTKPSLSPRK